MNTKMKCVVLAAAVAVLTAAGARAGDAPDVKTLAPFLHEVHYTKDYVCATDSAISENPSTNVAFACSAVRKGGFLGRNFDYFLDDVPTFIVHMDAAEGRLASVGVSQQWGMREDGVTNGQYTASYDLVPLMMLDGINECGVVIENNVVPAGDCGELTGTNPGEPDLNIAYVLRYVLDHATNAAHGVELIRSRNLVGDLYKHFYLHYMIADANETYVVEVVTNTVVARHMDIMTNFYLNWDNRNKCAVDDAYAAANGWARADYPAPYDERVTVDEIDRRYTPGSSGVERFHILRDNFDGCADSLEGMFDLMRRVKYTNLGREVVADSDIAWLTEYSSVTPVAELYETFKGEAEHDGLMDWYNGMAREISDDFERKEEIRKEASGEWQTVHNTTYDIENRMFRIAVQEDYEHTFDIYLGDSPIDVPMPVITFFAPDFTQGPTTEVPNVSWRIEGPLDRVTLTIDKETVYDGDTRNGEGRWRDLCRPGIHRLHLTARSGDEEASASCFYTALLEGEEPAVLPQIGYFYPDFYSGVEGEAPIVHWRADNITSVEIWVDAKCVLLTQDAVSEFRFSQLRNAGTHIVRIMAHNVTDDVESSFAYRTKRKEPVSLSAPPLKSVESAPVIMEFKPDAYDASIWETPYIHWQLDRAVESLQLTVDDNLVFAGDGCTGSGRWLDLSRLDVGEMNGTHDVTLSVSNDFGVATSNFTYTCHWAEPPPPPMGSEENPWRIGDDVQAYTNGVGGLILLGTGATSNFTGAADLPWIEVVDSIKSVTVPGDVDVVGENLWAALGENTVINDESIVRRKAIAAGFPVETPAGAISPAGVERIDIVDGKALLGVSVYTSDSIENPDWSVATSGVIEVPAPDKQGFFYLMSKATVQSNLVLDKTGRVDASTMENARMENGE